MLLMQQQRLFLNPRLAREKADGTVATIGYINTIPGGMNIVAEKCEFTVDIRSKSNDNINDIANRIRAALDREVKAMVDPMTSIQSL